MQFNLSGINNMSGGCMGMCQESPPYQLEIQKNVTGTDNFVTVWTYHTRLTCESERIPEFVLMTT